jgi:hypothetical protein
VRALIGNAKLPEPDPASHTAQESMVLGHRLNLANDSFAEQAEVSGIQWNIDMRDTLQYTVEGPIATPLDEAFLSPLAHGIDQVVSLFISS